MRRTVVIQLVGIVLIAAGCSRKDTATSDTTGRHERYHQAAAKLTAGGGPERDEALCKALAAVLEDLADRNDPSVYLAVSDSADPADPLEASTDLRRWEKDLDFRGRRYIILPQEVVFVDTAADKRQKIFFKQLQGAFQAACPDDLLKVVPLEAGAAREGKVVMDVHITFRRGPTYAKVRLANLAYLLRGFTADWELKLLDRQGKTMATITASSKSPRSLIVVKGEGGAEKFADPEEQLRYLGGVAASSQLEEVSYDIKGLLERKLGVARK